MENAAIAACKHSWANGQTLRESLITGRQFLDFSIIIPAKNEERVLGMCLDSLAALEYRKDLYEVVVVDNGSL
jgi:hypothetical protein